MSAGRLVSPNAQKTTHPGVCPGWGRLPVLTFKEVATMEKFLWFVAAGLANHGLSVAAFGAEHQHWTVALAGLAAVCASVAVASVASRL